MILITSTTFPIKLISKNSFINEIFRAVLIVAFIALFIFYSSMFPSEKSSTELKALWFIEGVPFWIKQLAFYGLITLVLALIIDFLNRRLKLGELVISEREIRILTRRKSLRLNYSELKEVCIVGRGLNIFDKESESLKIILKTNGDEIIRLKLLNYALVNELMDSLEIFEKKDIKLLAEKFDPYWPE